MSEKLSEEEKIAQEALKKIHKWLNREHSSVPKCLFPRLAIKYCGGCNPEVERGKIARILQQALGSEVYWSSPEEESELLLVIHGCSVACADRPDVTEKARAVLQVEGKTVSSLREANSPPRDEG